MIGEDILAPSYVKGSVCPVNRERERERRLPCKKRERLFQYEGKLKLYSELSWFLSYFHLKCHKKSDC